MAHHERNLLGRRGFLRRGLYGAAGLSVFCASAGCGRSAAALHPPPAEGTETIPSVARLSEWGEPGAPLVVRGRVFRADGKTPAEGLTLFLYHTDARGLYSEPRGGREPDPQIKGYVRTDREGAYEFRTTRPGAYPGRRNPQHIHVKVSGPDLPERYLEDYLFEDDTLVDASTREKFKDLGSFSPILKLTRDAGGVFRATRDIRLS